MEPTSEIAHSGDPLDRTLFYAGDDSQLDKFNPYFFIAQFPRSNSNYKPLLILFSQDDIQHIRTGVGEYRKEYLSDNIREDCLNCKQESALYEVEAFTSLQPLGDHNLRSVRLCGNCFESIREAVCEHIQEESQIVKYEL